MSLNIHIQDVHEQSGSFACGFCDKKYSVSRDKILHEKKHTGEKPYHCEKCDKGWSQYMAKKTAFTCETCQSTLLKVDSLVIDKKHASDDSDVKDMNEENNLVPDNIVFYDTNGDEILKAGQIFEERKHEYGRVQIGALAVGVEFGVRLCVG